MHQIDLSDQSTDLKTNHVTVWIEPKELRVTLKRSPLLLSRLVVQLLAPQVQLGSIKFPPLQRCHCIDLKFETKCWCRVEDRRGDQMDVEKSSLCNCVVNFLLEENYLLSAFELLHELLDDGRDDQAIRLKQFFSDPSQFPPDQISRFNSIRGLSLLMSLRIDLLLTLSINKSFVFMHIFLHCCDNHFHTISAEIERINPFN